MADLISMLAAASGTSSSLEFVAKEQINNVDITIPVTAQAGDLGLLLQLGLNSSSIVSSNVIPTGWTRACEVAVGSGFGSTFARGARLSAEYRILQSGDPGATVVGTNKTDGNYKVMFIFRLGSGPVSSVTPTLDFTYSSGSSGSVNPPVRTVVGSGTTPPVLIMGCGRLNNAYGFGNSQSTLSSSSSPAFQEYGNIIDGVNEDYGAYGYSIFNDSPTNVVIDLPATNADPRISLMGFSLQVS